MKKRIKVVVLMGGKTPEHEVSLISGREVVKNLNSKKFEVMPVVITRSGEKWQQISPQKILKLPDPMTLKSTGKELVPMSENNLTGVGQISEKNVDVVFIAMHGPFGEDGTVQGMLELAGLPYTGPGVLASALGMDKIMFRKVLESEGISVPKFVVVDKKDKLPNLKKKIGNLPYFVKPHNQGSSVGASIAKNKKELSNSLKQAFKFSDKVLIDEYIKGKELTCGVIGNDKPEALPLVEIIPLKGEFFDYESKYTESGAEEIVPARISKVLTKKVKKIAVQVYRLIGCKGFSRVDFILKENKPLVLEVNTIPGLTPMSLLPKAAKEAGYSYSKFLEKIIGYAI